jgi:electron transfer flavoprotein beta subunit
MADQACIASAVSFRIVPDGVQVLRKSDRGMRQEVKAPFPCTILFDEGNTPCYPSVDAVIRAIDAPVECWHLADLSLPFWKAGANGAYLAVAAFGAPRPDPVRVVTPDATLPAFERILSLLSGGIKPREGKVQQLSAEATAAGIWRIFEEVGLTARG